jgi:GAF domain-containing protein
VVDTREEEHTEHLGVDGAVAPLDPPPRNEDVRLRELEAESQLAAIMEIGSTVAEGGNLDETLDQIARTAARLVSAQAAALILREGASVDELVIAGSYGLSEEYLAELSVRLPLTVGKGPSGLAISGSVAVVVADVNTDPIIEPWRKAALREHYQALVSVPLRQREVIGVLNAYRADPGPWTKHELDLLGLLADHAAIAVQTARLLDESRRQVNGLSIMVRSLRAQTHEHSNRLHAIYGLLLLGEAAEAKQLIASLEEGYHSLYADVTNRIGNATVAGFLVAEASIARQSGIELTLDKRSRLAELPDRLSDLDAVTVLGNLLHNAIDAVSSMPRARRRVHVRFSQNAEQTTFRVRDWGVGAPTGDTDWIFGRNCSTKDGHAGIGLSLVAGIVRRCRGRVEVVQPKTGGLAIEVVFPS